MTVSDSRPLGGAPSSRPDPAQASADGPVAGRHGQPPSADVAQPDDRSGPEPTGLPAPSTWPYLMLALVVIVLDQISKYLIIDHFQYGERLPVIGGFFDLTLLYNPGAAFSFLAGHGGWQRWFFAAIAVAASVFLIYLMRQSRGQVLFSTALGLILGGAIGNLIDRLVLGHVTDFLLFHSGGWHFPAFNLADTAITIGAVLMIGLEVFALFRPKVEPSP